MAPLLHALAAATLSTARLVQAQPAGEGQRPNLLFLMADQLRWDANGYSGSADRKAFQTPALNRLKEEGVEFRYSWSSTPSCTPARAALLTGRSPWGHGMLGYGEVAPVYPVEYPRLLREAGYRTTVIGKDHFGWNLTEDKGIAHGFQQTQLYDGLGHWSPGSPNSWLGEWDDYDRWFAKEMPGKDPQATLDAVDGDGWNSWYGKAYIYNESLHPTAWVGRQAVQFLEAHPNGTDSSIQPFMLKVSFHRPHSPYDPPQRLLDAVSEEDLRPIKVCAGAVPDAHDDSGHGARWCLRFRGADGDPPGCANTADAWCGERPVQDTTLSRRAYAASVNFVDEWVGHIYKTLVERRLLERTFIIWTSDHGDGQGDMFHWRKGFPYEFAAHVPMLLRWPESWAAVQPPGSIIARGTTILPPVITELRDVFHTLVDAAGLARNSSLVPARGADQAHSFAQEDGKSMLCLLRDPSGAAHCNYPPNPGPWRKWLDLEHATCLNATNHWSALTDGRMKYVYRASYADEQLFNLTQDPDETVELSGSPDYAAELSLWRARMVQQFEQEGRGEGWVKDGKLVRRLNATLYSPNYPPAPPPTPFSPPKAGDHVIMYSNGGTPGCGTNDCWEVAGHGLRLVDNASLCLSVTAASPELEVAACAAVDSQHFAIGADDALASASPDFIRAAPGPISHVPSGRCVVASERPGQRPVLAGCDGTDDQVWQRGASGRICALNFGHLFLRAEAGSGGAGPSVVFV